MSIWAEFWALWRTSDGVGRAKNLQLILGRVA